MSATNAADSILTINDDLTTNSGTITLSAKDDVVFGEESDLVSNNGNVSVTADSDGTLTMADGASINSGSGTITLLADENIVIGGLTSTYASGTAITVTSDNGSITDAGDTDVDITASARAERLLCIGHHRFG